MTFHSEGRGKIELSIGLQLMADANFEDEIMSHGGMTIRISNDVDFTHNEKF